MSRNALLKNSELQFWPLPWRDFYFRLGPLVAIGTNFHCNWDHLLCNWDQLLGNWDQLFGNWDHLYRNWDQVFFIWDQHLWNWDQFFFQRFSLPLNFYWHKYSTYLKKIWGFTIIFGSKCQLRSPSLSELVTFTETGGLWVPPAPWSSGISVPFSSWIVFFFFNVHDGTAMSQDIY